MNIVYRHRRQGATQDQREVVADKLREGKKVLCVTHDIEKYITELKEFCDIYAEAELVFTNGRLQEGTYYVSEVKLFSNKNFWLSIRLAKDCVFSRRNGIIGKIIFGYSIRLRLFGRDVI